MLTLDSINPFTDWIGLLKSPSPYVILPKIKPEIKKSPLIINEDTNRTVNLLMQSIARPFGYE